MAEKINLPNFKIDQLPNIRLKSIHYDNFMVFKKHSLSFKDDFYCFIGPNGSGKSTILDSIQLIFSRFDGCKKDRLVNNLSQLIRHEQSQTHGAYNTSDFLITAEIESEFGNYEVQINKNGFIKDHPEQIKDLIYRICFYTRFDQELNIFQLERGQWEKFKELFESVTGYETKEITTMFDQSEDPVQAQLLNKYVLSFDIYKPNETIRHTECSAGEKKIIKSFSTLLNKEYTPKIILVDNIEMHVESGRHLNLIQSMKKCFPSSQIFATTHSYQISRNFGNRSQLYDLRMINAPDFIKKHKWRLYIADEIKDYLSKLKAMSIDKDIIQREVQRGEEIIRKCLDSEFNVEKDYTLKDEAELFLKQVVHLFLLDVMGCYKK